jgi:DNA polymerase-3 subunit delta
MRIYPKKFLSIAPSITNSAICAVLLYGPDKGMIECFIQDIKQILSLNLRKIDVANIANINLAQITNSISLFMQKEIIVLKNFGSSLTKENKEILGAPLGNFLIIVADELSSTSSLRQFFEKHQHLASIACYPDSHEDIKFVISAYMQKKGKSLTRDAMFYIQANVNIDRQFLYSELDKLCLYCHDSSIITLSEAKQTVSVWRSSSVDKMCIAFIKKDADTYFNELDELCKNSSPEILMIRSLMKYYTNIFIVKQKMAAGSSLDEAVKSLAPPIFFLYVEQFKELVTKTPITNITYSLQQLIKAEIALKSNAQNGKIIFENIF